MGGLAVLLVRAIVLLACCRLNPICRAATAGALGGSAAVVGLASSDYFGGRVSLEPLAGKPLISGSLAVLERW